MPNQLSHTGQGLLELDEQEATSSLKFDLKHIYSRERELHHVKIQIPFISVKCLNLMVGSCWDIPSKRKNKLCAFPLSALMTGTALSGFLWILEATRIALGNSCPTYALRDSEGCEIPSRFRLQYKCPAIWAL